MSDETAVEKLAEIARSWEYSYEWGCMADEILAAIQADPLAYVKPKPLEWVNGRAGIKIAFYEIYKTSSIAGEKLVWVCVFSPSHRTWHETEEAAQAAAYDDLCKRVAQLLKGGDA